MKVVQNSAGEVLGQPFYKYGGSWELGGASGH